jgi:glycosyltransferase involved in cell wall biosynthesis
MREAIRDMEPDVVLVNMFEFHLSPAALRPLAKVPSVLMVHYYKPICPNGMKLLPDGRICHVRAGLVCLRTGCTPLPLWVRDRPRYALIRSGLRGFDRFLTVSEWMERKLAANGLHATGLPLPVAPPRPGFRRERAEHPLFVYLGRLAHEKGLDFLLRAFARMAARHPGARLRLVGAGAERERLGRLARDLGVAGAVELPGPVPPDRVGEALAPAWAVVVPSLLPEPGAIVALEAIVHGVPVLGGATGGVAEVVEPGVSGLLFPNGDEGALASRLEEVARGGLGDVPPEMAERALERHSRERHLGALRAALEEVAAAGAATGAP